MQLAKIHTFQRSAYCDCSPIVFQGSQHKAFPCGVTSLYKATRNGHRIKTNEVKALQGLSNQIASSTAWKLNVLARTREKMRTQAQHDCHVVL